MGFRGVDIPEHHLAGILPIPSPLPMAVKSAAHTSHLKLITSVCQLPRPDIRVSQAKSSFGIELRGHGASPVPKPPHALGDLVEDLEALRRELGIAKAHVAGHSLGGVIGPAYARTYKQHVSTVGRFSTAGFRTEDDSAKVRSVVAAVNSKGTPQVLETSKDH